MWSPRLDAVSRDELISIQNEKLNAADPFVYENSPFYRRQFERFGSAIISTIHDRPFVEIVNAADIAGRRFPTFQ